MVAICQIAQSPVAQKEAKKNDWPKTIRIFFVNAIGMVVVEGMEMDTGKE
jgi:hypothetical protein